MCCQQVAHVCMPQNTQTRALPSKAWLAWPMHKFRSQMLGQDALHPCLALRPMAWHTDQNGQASSLHGLVELRCAKRLGFPSWVQGPAIMRVHCFAFCHCQANKPWAALLGFATRGVFFCHLAHSNVTLHLGRCNSFFAKTIW